VDSSRCHLQFPTQLAQFVNAALILASIPAKLLSSRAARLVVCLAKSLRLLQRIGLPSRSEKVDAQPGGC
jgi:hypothetical protein